MHKKTHWCVPWILNGCERAGTGKAHYWLCEGMRYFSHHYGSTQTALLGNLPHRGFLHQNYQSLPASYPLRSYLSVLKEVSSPCLPSSTQRVHPNSDHFFLLPSPTLFCVTQTNRIASSLVSLCLNLSLYTSLATHYSIIFWNLSYFIS